MNIWDTLNVWVDRGGAGDAAGVMWEMHMDVQIPDPPLKHFNFVISCYQSELKPFFIKDKTTNI